ncbi:hypothetical protein ECDEC14C_4334 [Escherichia coli DEC14C]|nr:hypothetical protein ECDEC14C_4334 [Escherichia coli DEC14C]
MTPSLPGILTPAHILSSHDSLCQNAPGKLIRSHLQMA